MGWLKDLFCGGEDNWLQEAAGDSSSPSKYTKEDAARETGASIKETSRAHHQAKNDCQDSEHPYDKKLAASMVKRGRSEK